MATPPAVTVLMAVYNGERFLEEAVRSVLAQSFSSFEFLIIDDGSTDGTASMLDGITDNRVRVLRNATNLGLSASLNRGLANARGEFLARLDADDVSEPIRLERQVRFLRANPAVALVGSGCWIIDDTGHTRSRSTEPRQHAVLRWNLPFYCPFWHSAVMWRREIVADRVGEYNTAYGYAMDHEFWVRIAATLTVANIDAPLIRYRVGPHAMSANHPRRESELLSARYAAAHAIFPDGSAERSLWDKEGARILQIVDGWAPSTTPDEIEWVTTTIWNLAESYCARSVPDPASAVGVKKWTRRWLSRQLLQVAIDADRTGDVALRDTAFRVALRWRPSSIATFSALRYARARLGLGRK